MKYLLTILTFLLVAFHPTPTSAQIRNEVRQVGTQSAWQERILKQQERQEEIRKEIMERVQERKATRSAALAEFRKERIRHFFNLISLRIEAAINRLERIIARIESRIAKIEAENTGINPTSIKNDVQKAKDLVAEARVSLEALKSNLEVALASEQPKDSFAVIREGLKDIRDNLVEVHRILVHVIGDIKGLRVGVGKLTPTVTPTPVPTGAI